MQNINFAFLVSCYMLKHVSKHIYKHTHAIKTKHSQPVCSNTCTHTYTDPYECMYNNTALKKGMNNKTILFFIPPYDCQNRIVQHKTTEPLFKQFW